jgi:hypothetical protein
VNFVEPRTPRCATTPTNLPLDKQSDSTLTVPGAADQATLDALARRINALYRKATLEVVCAIGRLVLDELYEGKVDLWCREGTRRTSYRRLAARGDLLLSPSALCRAVAVSALCERLGGRAVWPHLTASHLQEVLALEGAQQERLLRAADKEHWTVSRLRAEVVKQRPQRSRTQRPRVKQTVGKLKIVLAEVQSTLSDRDAIRGLDAELAREIGSMLSDLRSHLDVLRRRLDG